MSAAKTSPANDTQSTTDVEMGEVIANPTAKGVGTNKRGLVITFKDLTYTVKHRKTKEDLNLLSGVNGFFKPGQMSALMGPSGSGKTTLLDVLAGRKTVGNITGDVRFGAEKPIQAFLKRNTGYVEQFDTLLETLTVWEMIMYTAELKLPEGMPYEEKVARVDDMISQLKLDKCRDTKIGSSLARGVSGGQAKRVNIAISLITDPSILFLDEPTSGLDSHTATEVMSVVKALAATGDRTICATIHSPSAFTFKQFDALLLLADGRTAYFGPNGPQAISYFSQNLLPGIAPYESGDNESEWIMEIATSAAASGQARTLTDMYEASHQARENLAELKQLKASNEVEEVVASTKCQLLDSEDSGTSVGFGKAFRTLWQYRTLRHYKSPQYLGAHIADKVLVVFILMTLYANRGDRTTNKGIQDITGMLFLWTTLASFGATSYVPTLVVERALFYREQADGLYSVGTYLFSKLFEEMSLGLLVTCVLSLPVYYIIGLKGSFLILWMVYFVTLSVGIAAAYLFAALSPTVDFANAALPAYLVSLLYFSGMVMNFKSIPKYWDWYSHLNFVRYGFTSLLVNHFEGRDIKMLEEPVLEYWGVGGEDKWANLGYQSLFFLAFAMLAYLALKYVRHDKR